MYVIPDGEFVATSDIMAVKEVRVRNNVRYSAVPPIYRGKGWGLDTGCTLQYPRGEWVMSPEGPGIYCYYPHRTEAAFGLELIDLIIPRGAVVKYFGSGYSTWLVLAASEVLVVT